ncbi:MAG: hypothetical protein Harvfovirus34_9 [Harvfovirus sp.]|uniref:Uncharacterized protein n=1 Tax=Harvfovirus sp. TaxID=2487768 RepID=A0A3G5A4N0_9VIRU|nr:MAG: hypothetical protein Harvfovirus34_9 [Harvfovirus sp.]
MTQIKLEGFEIFSHLQTYILPINSYVCACGIKVYLIENFCHELRIFKLKFFKKYRELVRAGVNPFDKYIPVEIITQNSMCELHPIEISCNSTYKYPPGAIFLTPSPYNINFPTVIDKLYLSLLESNDFEMGGWVGRFAVNYWATCQYNFYKSCTVNSTIEQKKIYISEAAETKLLEKIQIDVDKLTGAIYNAIGPQNVIGPLVNLICEYNCSAIQMMGKIITQFKNDIEKYIE